MRVTALEELSLRRQVTNKQAHFGRHSCGSLTGSRESEVGIIIIHIELWYTRHWSHVNSSSNRVSRCHACSEIGMEVFQIAGLDLLLLLPRKIPQNYTTNPHQSTNLELLHHWYRDPDFSLNPSWCTISASAQKSWWCSSRAMTVLNRAKSNWYKLCSLVFGASRYHKETPNKTAEETTPQPQPMWCGCRHPVTSQSLGLIKRHISTSTVALFKRLFALSGGSLEVCLISFIYSSRLLLPSWATRHCLDATLPHS